MEGSANPLRGAESFGRGGDPLVGRGERETDVLGEVRPVEVPRTGEDSEVREPVETLPRVASLGGPQVEARLTRVDPEARALHGGLEHGTAGAVAALLLLHVCVVGGRGRTRGRDEDTRS